jgi:hypothetical protein
MSDYELDHLFVAARPQAPEMEALLDLGLAEGTRNRHPGQGTANRRVFFPNVMLELLWLTDLEEAQSDAIRHTYLAERCDPTRADVCPFGVCLRPVDGVDGPLPFETWSYTPPYLPPGMSISVAMNAGELHEPFLFAIPFGGRPDRYPAERQQPLDHPAGLREVTTVKMTLPSALPYSSALRYLYESGLVELVTGKRYRLHLDFDHGAQGRSASLEPMLPLILSW